MLGVPGFRQDTKESCQELRAELEVICKMLSFVYSFQRSETPVDGIHTLSLIVISNLML
jgi:hypothetical protein